MPRIQILKELIELRQSTPDHWPERWGSYVIAGCVGLTAAVIAYVTPVQRMVEENEFSLPLIFALSPPLEEEAEPLLKDETLLEPEPLPEPLETQSTIPEFEESAATTVKLEREEEPEETDLPPLEEESQANELEDSPTESVQIALAIPEKTALEKLQEEMLEESQEPEPETPELPPSLEEWKPDNALKERQLNKLMNRISDQEANLQSQRDGIRAALNRREVETTGREFLFNSDGGKQGVIRLLDVEGFPTDVVKRVYARYGIDVDYRYLRPEDLNTKRTYFNKVITNDDSFTTKREAGYYEVFQLSSKAISLLAGLEREAITSQQRDPRNTRVRSVTFGIILNDRNEYALGVTDLQFERLR